MTILLVNDDGIHEPGLMALYEVLSAHAQVRVVAPMRQKSGASSSLTVHAPMKCEKVYKNGSFFGYAIDGTPADCAKLGIYTLFDSMPDLVFTGINPGSNISTNIYYSGTVAAASEGQLAGITSVAISQSTKDWNNCDFTPSASVAKQIFDMLQSGRLPQGELYNVNVPNRAISEIKGWKTTVLSRDDIKLTYKKDLSPLKDEYFWLAGYEPDSGDYVENSDVAAIMDGYVSLTPLKRNDRTHYDLLNKLNI